MLTRHHYVFYLLLTTHHCYAVADDCSPMVWYKIKEHSMKKNPERQAENVNSIFLSTSGLSDYPSMSVIRARVPTQYCRIHQQQLIECENAESESSDADLPTSKDLENLVRRS